MPLSTSAQTRLQYQEESEFGVIETDDTTNKVKDLRFTGESLAFAISKTESAEIRSDRQLADLVPVGANASGGINFELSYREYDDLLRAALMGAWAEYGTKGVGASITLDGSGIAADSFSASAPTSGSDDWSTLAKGQWFRLVTTGGTGANNGKIFRTHPTTACTASKITVDPSTPLTADAGATAATVQTSRLTNGVTERSFTIERGLLDVNQFFAYRGMELSKLNIKIASGSISTGSFDFMGKDAVRDATSNFGSNTPVASQTHDVHNGVSGVGQVFEGGAALAGTFIKSIDFSLDNTLRARDAIGTLGAVSIGNGQCKVTGTIEVYLADGTMYDKFLNNTLSSIAVVSKDAAGNGYAFTFPAVRYGDAKVNAGGKDQDIMLSMPFTAIIDAANTGKTLLIDRFGV